MSENINFIPANSLPVAEGDEVSVLCLENGAMKQKPGASLGGGEKADLVLNLVGPVLTGSGDSGNISVTIETGSLDAVVEALAAGRPPVVKVKHFGIAEPNLPVIEGGVYDCSVVHYADSISFMFAIPTELMVKIVMNLDDPDYLQVWVYPLVKSALQVI